jgi:hypothetical protein
MSSPHSKPTAVGDLFVKPVNYLATPDGSLPFVPTADRAIDAALKCVPLPEGLLSRLGLMVSTMPEELSDPVDYLGC